MSTFSLQWSHVLLGLFILGLLFALALTALALFIVWKRGQKPAPAPKASERIAPAAVARAPALVVDPEEYAKRVAYLTAKQMIARQAPAPPTDISKYQDLQAIADERNQKDAQIAATKAAMAKVAAAIGEANTVATAARATP